MTGKRSVFPWIVTGGCLRNYISYKIYVDAEVGNNNNNNNALLVLQCWQTQQLTMPIPILTTEQKATYDSNCIIGHKERAEVSTWNASMCTTLLRNCSSRRGLYVYILSGTTIITNVSLWIRPSDLEKRSRYQPTFYTSEKLTFCSCEI